MATPWRVKTVGSLPTLAHAAGGDWHRDIGEGLFRETLDLALPDYYFNALVLHFNFDINTAQLPAPATPALQLQLRRGKW